MTGNAKIHTVILVRTHYFDASIGTLADRLASESGLDVALLVDETKTPLTLDPRFNKVPIDRAALTALNLNQVERATYYCGDYGLYVARKALPQYRFYWLIEPDVKLNFASLAGFFDIFSTHQEDLVAPHLRAAKKGEWWWYDSMEPFTSAVYMCLFPLVRVSARALDYLLPRRVALTERYAALAAPNGKKTAWPNDEAFVASELANSELTCVGISQIKASLCSYQTFKFGSIPFSLKEILSRGVDDKVYHPVLTGRAYIDKLYALLDEARRAGRITEEVRPILTPRCLASIKLESSDAEADAFRARAEEILAGLGARSPF